MLGSIVEEEEEKKMIGEANHIGTILHLK